MKIVILQDDFPPVSFGGAGIIAYRLARGYKDKGHEVIVITITNKRDEEGLGEYEGLKVYKIYSRYNLNWRFYFGIYNYQVIRKLKKILSDEKPDIVHAHNILQYISIYSLKAAKQSGAKVFLTAHDCMLFHYGKLNEFIDQDNPFEWERKYSVSSWQQIKKYKKAFVPFRRTIIKHYLKYVNKIFSVSNALKDALNQNRINNVEVIHNGINIDEWKEDQAEINKFINKYNLRDKKVILFGGRLGPAKGGVVIVEALKEIVSEFSNAVLLVLGTKDRFAEKMQEKARALGIEKNLIFTGWISGAELKAGYWCADIVTTPSLYLDPFPTVNLEACACGKPVVGTCFGGTPEIIENKKNGLIINPYNVFHLAKALSEILASPEKQISFGSQGKGMIEKQFKLYNQISRYIFNFEL